MARITGKVPLAHRTSVSRPELPQQITQCTVLAALRAVR
jgi:hypothetical protein